MNWKTMFVTLFILVVLLAVIAVWVLGTKTARLEIAETKLAEAESLLVVEQQDAHANRNCYKVAVATERFRADKKRYPNNAVELIDSAKLMNLFNPYNDELLAVRDSKPTKPGEIAYLPTVDAKGNITEYEVMTVYYDGISSSVWFP